MYSLLKQVVALLTEREFRMGRYTQRRSPAPNQCDRQEVARLRRRGVIR